MASPTIAGGHFKQYAFTWNPSFETPQTSLYSSDDKSYVEDPPVNGRLDLPLTTDSVIRKFVSCQCADEVDRHIHQSFQFATFLKGVNLEALRNRPTNSSSLRPKILVDDRNDTTVTRSHLSGNSRPSRPLDVYEFYIKLRDKRVVPIIPSVPGQGIEQANSNSNAERRVMYGVFDYTSYLLIIVRYITDVDPLCVMALAATLSRPQLPLVRGFIYKHLLFRSLIGVDIPIDSKTFALEFHLPYYAWRRMPKLKIDERVGYNGKQIRRSERVIPSRTKSKRLFECIYEAQLSVLITGFDNWFWTAYCFVDTYFKNPDENKERVEHYCNAHFKLDPLSCGKHSADRPIWSPRAYFLRTLSCRMQQVTQEWNNSIAELVERIEPYIDTFEMDDTDATTGAVNELRITQERGFKWTIRVLRQFTHLISKTIDAWDTFNNGEIRYFYLPESEQLAQATWGGYLASIDKHVTDLRDLRRSLQHQTELFENMTNSLATHAALGASRAALEEARTTRHQSEFIRALTVVTICYLPPSLATTIFSMQDSVLKGHPTLRHWSWVLVGLSALTALLVWIVSKGRWLWERPDRVPEKRRAARLQNIPSDDTTEEETNSDGDNDSDSDVDSDGGIELQEQRGVERQPSPGEIV